MSFATLLDADVEWIVSEVPVGYPDALAWMEARAADVADGVARECIWLLEHPPLYTAGTSANPADLIDPRFPVFVAGRGGQYTYHGPGQRVAYVILDLNKRGRDIRRYVHSIEEWIIGALGRLGVAGRREQGRIGIWADDPYQGEAKIAALGIRIRRWVTFHGFAINVAPDLSHFAGIVPCGISQYGITSLRKLEINVPLARMDAALLAQFASFLGELNRPQST